MRGDLVLIDQLIDSLYQARRLLQFVTTGPGLPGQYRINPTAPLSSRNLAILHNIPPGFQLPPELSSRSPAPAPRTPPQDAERFHHYWTGPPPQTTPAPNISNATRTRETVLDPATPAVAKCSIQLPQQPCSAGPAAAEMLLPTPETTPPATVADTSMLLGLTDIPTASRKNLAS